MTPKRKKPATKRRFISHDFDVELTILQNRKIFLQQEIEEDVAEKINKQLFALDTVNHNPIMMYLDSPGGSCNAGMSIINTMKMIESPVVTIIYGDACSMAGQISIVGDKRVACQGTSWMGHDLETEYEGTGLKLIDRAKYIEKYQKILDTHMRKYTNLSNKQIERALIGELWLLPDDMLKYGLIDEIIIHEDKK